MSRAALTGSVDRLQNGRRPDGGRRPERPPDPAGVLDALDVSSGTTLAAVGRGDGRLALAAAERVAPAAVYAVDVDGTLLDEIEVRALEQGVENLTTISGDAGILSERLPERVDVVLIAGGLLSVESAGAAAEQVWRSLRPGGRLVVVNPRERSWEETRPGVEAADFEVVREVDLPPHHYGLVFERAHDR